MPTPTDPSDVVPAGTPPSPAAGDGWNRPAVVLVVLCLAQFMLVLDAAVVAVAVPAIQADLTLSPARVQGTATAYAVTFGGFLILAGRAADAFGARRAFLAGLAVFTAASALCPAAPSAAVLVGGRAIQWLGAAIASPAALAAPAVGVR